MRDFSKRQCLVIDDFQGMRTLLRDMLRELGVARVPGSTSPASPCARGGMTSTQRTSKGLLADATVRKLALSNQ